LILADEAYAVAGAAMEVYYKLGSGFLEPVYQQALGIEFARRNVPFEQQKRFRIEYKGTILDKEYVADFVCYDQVIVEIKAINQLSPVDWAQVINYLKVSKMRVGLLFNFGSVGKLEWKRLVI
jgi:GxxExxY protein